MIISFLLGFLCYSFGAYLSNSETLKSTQYYLPLALSSGIIANYIWFTLARKLTNSNDVLITGFYWDIMITLAFLLVPILFFQVNLDTYKMAGLFLIFCGIILTKI